MQDAMHLDTKGVTGEVPDTGNTRVGIINSGRNKMRVLTSVLAATGLSAAFMGGNSGSANTGKPRFGLRESTTKTAASPGPIHVLGTTKNKFRRKRKGASHPSSHHHARYLKREASRRRRGI